MSREIDRQVAERLGWTWFERYRFRSWCGYPPNGLTLRRVPFFTTNIVSAIRAIEGFGDWHLQKSPPSCCLKINGVWGDTFNESTLALSICAAILATTKSPATPSAGEGEDATTPTTPEPGA